MLQVFQIIAWCFIFLKENTTQTILAFYYAAFELCQFERVLCFSGIILDFKSHF